jgi:hypothetical protein
MRQSVIGILLFTQISVYSQSLEDLPKFNSIRTPNSPAFVILGVQPTSIDRPNTPSDLAVAVENATEGFSKFPKNFSIEFSPYWLSKDPMKLTWQDDTIRSIEESVFRTFSVSFATTNKEIAAKEVMGLSYGFRMQLLSGQTSKKSVSLIKKLEKELKQESFDYTRIISEEEDVLLAERSNRLSKPGITPEEESVVNKWYIAERSKLAVKRQEIHKRQEEERLKAAEKADKDVQSFAPQRDGFMFEIAYASAYGNDTANYDLQKRGYAFWITPSYVRGDYSVVGVFRTMKDSLDNKSNEFGVRFILTKDHYAISVEHLKGTYTSNESSFTNRERFSVLMEYMLSNALWLNLSFGDDNKNIQNKSTLFTTLGIRYNLAGKRYSFER